MLHTRHVPASVAHSTTAAFADEGKKDAHDAVAIAHTVGLRGDLATVAVLDGVANSTC